MFSSRRLLIAFATFTCTLTIALVGLMLFVPQTAEGKGKPDTFLCCECGYQPQAADDQNCTTGLDRFELRSYCYTRWGGVIFPGSACYDKKLHFRCDSCSE
jgi:hypothetical protein